jgi:hypothetical protein
MIDAAMMLAWTRWSGSQFDERFTQDLSGLGKMDVFAVVVPFSSGDSETAGFGPKNFFSIPSYFGDPAIRTVPKAPGIR